MKTLTKLFALAVIIFGFSATSYGQTNTVSQTASATVLKPLTIESTTPLDFGTFGGLNTAVSTVILSVTGARSGTVDLVGTNGVAGVFTISGESNSAITISMPTVTTQLVGTGTAAGGDPMTILSSDWTTDKASLSSVSLGGTGTITLNVGATLNVGIAQKAGPYSGSYSVTVNYN